MSLVQISSIATHQLCLNLLIDFTSLSLSFLKENDVCGREGGVENIYLPVVGLT